MTPQETSNDVGELVDVGELAALVARVFEACGVGAAPARTVADVLVTADARGVSTHGVALLPWYVAGLRTGRIDPSGRPSVVRDQGSVLVVDGGGGLGHLAAIEAVNAAVDRARATGVAAVAVRNSSHAGAAGHYARLAADSGLIGMIFLTAVPTMAPPGGHERLLGNNPWAVAIPTPAGPPFVLDTAFSAVSRGRIVAHARDGLPLRPGWARASDGTPTIDANQALAGLLEPIGGYKGAGMAIAVGLLATALGGASFGTDLGTLDQGNRPGQDGLFAMAIDPAAFDAPETVLARIGASIDALRGGGDAVTLPGDRSAEASTRSGTDGIVLPRGTRTALAQLCADLGVDAELLA